MNPLGELKYYDPKEDSIIKKPFTQRLRDAGVIVVKENGKDRSEYDKAVAMGPAIVAFFADWCPHCHSLEFPFSELAKAIIDENKKTVNQKRGLRYSVIAVNAEMSPNLSNDMQVESYPTIFIYDGKGRYNRYTGKRDSQSFANALFKLI